MVSSNLVLRIPSSILVKANAILILIMSTFETISLLVPLRLLLFWEAFIAFITFTGLIENIGNNTIPLHKVKQV